MEGRAAQVLRRQRAALVAYLADELVSLGHQVTLFASGDSVTKAKLEAVWPQALRLDPTPATCFAPHMLMLEQVARRAEDFDVIHLHVDYLGLFGDAAHRVPYVSTLHGRLDLPPLQQLYKIFSDVPRRVDLGTRSAGPLPHAKLRGDRPSRPARTDADAGIRRRRVSRLLGRISPEKAPDAAIRIAAKAGLPLKDRGQRSTRFDREYFAERIEPSSTPIACRVHRRDRRGAEERVPGPTPPRCSSRSTGSSRSASPMIEAMACGHARDRAAPQLGAEVIDRGVTGFIFETEDESRGGGPSRAHARPPRRVRRTFEERYTARRMAEDYVQGLPPPASRASQPLREAV